MKIILADGKELNPILVTGGTRTVYGASRDTLQFVFTADDGMEALDAAFTDVACETITLDDGNEQYIHKGYTIRVELKKAAVEIAKSTPDADAVYQDRIYISMAQRTYAETQLAQTKAALDALLANAKE